MLVFTMSEGINRNALEKHLMEIKEIQEKEKIKIEQLKTMREEIVKK